MRESIDAFAKRKRKLERDIEYKCVGIAAACDWAHAKLEKVKRSWPDHLFLGPYNEHFIVEFKRPGEKPRKQQDARIATLRSIGHAVYVLTSVDQFRRVMAFHCRRIEYRRHRLVIPERYSIHPEGLVPARLVD